MVCLYLLFLTLAEVFMNAAFRERLLAHTEHVKKVGHMCATEETTKQALILPLLDILGFSAFDPSKVRAEYQADFAGIKSGERVDYALFCQNTPVMFIEAKSFNEDVDNHCPQLSRYFNATPDVAICAITNGREWRFFTDLANKNRGCTRLALNSTPLPQDFKLPGWCAEVKSKFAFFQEQRERFAIDSVVLA